jgi:hypothetical protein
MEGYQLSEIESLPKDEEGVGRQVIHSGFDAIMCDQSNDERHM